jgi:hypothetical protein
MKTDLKEIECEYVDWTHLAQNRVQMWKTSWPFEQLSDSE